MAMAIVNKLCHYWKRGYFFFFLNEEAWLYKDIREEEITSQNSVSSENLTLSQASFDSKHIMKLIINVQHGMYYYLIT